MPELLLIAWRGIPAQLLARDGRRSARRELAPRFAEAIDRAAMRGGARDETAYLAGWTRTPLGPCGEDLDSAVADAAGRIEAEYDAERLAALVQAGGVA
ncbi:virulence factor [Falsiroseomonas sp. HW251]|uniref:virulence factor n=1 Tax=Falsiroseomonas sp. HW251 TaxID=3390998 RepID=UPI003D312352